MSDYNEPKSEQRSAHPDKLDRAAFERQAGPFRRELRLHCYRMMGSPNEAEDLVQEAYLRAWRSLDSFEGRGSLRAWLYQIATNVCLNALAHRKDQHRLLPDQRSLPTQQMPSGDPPTDIAWLAPYPDSHWVGIADDAPGPAARYETHESVQLAFLALIQQLPPRQRAVMLLSDVLGWSTREVTSLLGGSSASINSALQRARATLSQRYPEDRPRGASIPDQAQRALIERYVRAWESADLDGFVSLLKEDATYAMPPSRQWYRGRDSIRAFLAYVWRGRSGFRLVATGANGQPAFALYNCKPGDPTYRAHSIEVLEIQGDAISAVTKYMKPLAPELFAEFGLPLTLAEAQR
jgi:RNA polymerase sigma-70 factor (ECF subfamily)